MRNMVSTTFENSLKKFACFYLVQVCSSSNPRWNTTWGDTYDVLHLTHLIEGHDWASLIADFFHSGVGFQKKTWPYDKYVAEFWANTLNMDTIIPKLENGQEVFNNAVTARILPVDDFQGWKIHKAGSVSGHIFDRYGDWIRRWMSDCPGYQLWSVASSLEMTDTTSIYLRECDCHRFAEDSLARLYDMGGDFSTQEPFCRNYFPLLSSGSPQIVSGHDPQLRSFYKEFRAIYEKFSVRNVLAKIFTWITRQYQPYFYVFQSIMNDPGQFYLVSLDSPKFLDLPSYSSQRMLLPWQDNSQAVYCSYTSRTEERAESQPLVVV